MYDRLIRNGTIVDGTGGERQVGDIAVKDGQFIVRGRDTYTVGVDAWRR